MAMVIEDDGGRSFQLLGEGECLWLLEKKSVGRVAVSMGALPFVAPVNYALCEGAIYFLTGEGTKLAAAVRGTVVAFEIDEVSVPNHHGWSVLAVGEAREVDDAEAKTLLARLPLAPWAPGAREHLVRIVPEFLSGRRIGFARTK
jgi:nitroimidazol reductase NimA-like FMN-containing flavoprotein (pyridoxamine 5'-phosphate oxidase superfamily)